jgi:hypothetical protein
MYSSAAIRSAPSRSRRCAPSRALSLNPQLRFVYTAPARSLGPAQAAITSAPSPYCSPLDRLQKPILASIHFDVASSNSRTPSCCRAVITSAISTNAHSVDTKTASLQIRRVILRPDDSLANSTGGIGPSGLQSPRSGNFFGSQISEPHPMHVIFFRSETHEVFHPSCCPHVGQEFIASGGHVLSLLEENFFGGTCLRL